MENNKTIDRGNLDTQTKVKRFFVKNMVTILFIVLGYIGFHYSGLSVPFFMSELITRFARNGFLVLALIIPVMAGMGLNFAIVLGAMAGQVGIIMVAHWGIQGWIGILVCVLLATPVALFLGFLTGKLLNKTKGQEMITSLILGFFANGVYQFIFLILVGSIIPMKNEELILSSGVGLRVTIALNDTVRYALDDIWRVGFIHTILAAALLFFVLFSVKLYKMYKGDIVGAPSDKTKTYFNIGVTVALLAVALGVMFSESAINNLQVPVVTFGIIGLLCLFTYYITQTKLGQDLRTVGQDLHIAKVSGINSDGIRLLAIMLSTLLAAYGQIIYLQNLGTLSTYGSHEQVGMFAIAALLIGGASVTKATIGQAILGTLLFHTMFIVSPLAGREIFGDAQLGEYFRAFVAYGVIGLSLAMHAWKKHIQSKDELGA